VARHLDREARQGGALIGRLRRGAGSGEQHRGGNRGAGESGGLAPEPAGNRICHDATLGCLFRFCGKQGFHSINDAGYLE
jgi:hypothetical protein